ncbi:Manganese transporter smf1 [Tilletia horrida]|nr:Manganese transporter smf1 [Tilletia horrida]
MNTSSSSSSPQQQQQQQQRATMPPLLPLPSSSFTSSSSIKTLPSPHNHHHHQQQQQQQHRPQSLNDDDDDEYNNSSRASSITSTSFSFRQCCTKVKTTLSRHAAFIGPGIVASVAYADPGNWATDLQAGASHGYKLLFAVLLSGLFAILLQVLACRLGIVTGLDLACASRQLILGPFGARRSHHHAPASSSSSSSSGTGSGRTGGGVVVRPRWEKWVRYSTLWAIYLIAEAAIVATELAELVGSAIALNLLFPRLPLWAGVLVTSADVFLILFVYRPNGGLRAFEILIGTLVVIVLACYVVLLVRVKPDWGDVFQGYLPSSTLVQHDALYIAVGILGATVMPHGLFLGSHFSTVDRLNKGGCDCSDEQQQYRSGAAGAMSSPQELQDASSLSRRSLVEDDAITPIERTASASPPTTKTLKDRALHLLVRLFPRIDASAFASSSTARRFHFSSSKNEGRRRNREGGAGLPSGPRIPDMIDPDRPPEVRLEMVKTHLPHASIDIALSLLAFAITINSAILIVAAAATARNGGREVGDLFEAFDLLRTTVSQGAAILFAIALLAAGQSASLTVCLAGQIISEGFIRWRTSPLTRRILTRVIAMVPSLIVAAAVGKDGVDSLLVGSQVVLSMALPFVTAPLLIMTCLKSWMRVWEDTPADSAGAAVGATAASSQTPAAILASSASATPNVQVVPAPLPSKTPPPLPALAPAPGAADVPFASSSSPSQLENAGRWHHFQTWWPVAVVAWAVFGVICVADVFTLATL